MIIIKKIIILSIVMMIIIINILIRTVAVLVNTSSANDNNNNNNNNIRILIIIPCTQWNTAGGESAANTHRSILLVQCRIKVFGPFTRGSGKQAKRAINPVPTTGPALTTPRTL